VRTAWLEDTGHPVEHHRCLTDPIVPWRLTSMPTGSIRSQGVRRRLMEHCLREDEPAFERRCQAFGEGMPAGEAVGLIRAHFDVDLAAPDCRAGSLAILTSRVEQLVACLDAAPFS